MLYLASECSRTFVSMIKQPNTFKARSFSSEYGRRLASNLLDGAVNQPDDWLRRKQNLLAMKGPALWQTVSEWEEIEGVSCLRVSPRNSETRARVLYLHGGGFVVGSARSYQYMGAKLALALGAEVILVDYPLAPEHPVDESIDACKSVFNHIQEHEEPKTLTVMGDSAGGGLAMALLQELSDLPVKTDNVSCVLISPWVAPARPDLLERSAETGDLLSVAILDKWYRATQMQGSDSARFNFLERDWSGFPPTYIQAAGAEIFLPQINLLTECMRKDGVDVQYDVFPDQFHVFQTLAPLVREADAALDKIAGYVHGLA